MSIPASIDLHAHLRGTMKPSSAVLLSERNSTHLPTGVFDKNRNYTWTDFESFLEVYQVVGNVVRDAADLTMLTTEYLGACGASNTLYVELMWSPTHLTSRGLTYSQQVAAIAAGIESSNRSSGIEARLIATCVRQRGPSEALELAEHIASNRHPLVTGFGLTGNERLFDVEAFSGAFMVARSAKLGLTAHAGEWRDAKSVLQAVKSLDLARVGHGISVTNDKAVLDELVSRNIGFEVCLSSNLALGVCKHIKEHPLSKMLAAGCRISLCTDDAAYFDTLPAQEYALAHSALGLSHQKLLRVTLESIDMAFCDDLTKARLRARVAAS